MKMKFTFLFCLISGVTSLAEARIAKLDANPQVLAYHERSSTIEAARFVDVMCSKSFQRWKVEVLETDQDLCATQGGDEFRVTSFRSSLRSARKMSDGRIAMICESGAAYFATPDLAANGHYCIRVQGLEWGAGRFAQVNGTDLYSLEDGNDSNIKERNIQKITHGCVFQTDNSMFCRGLRTFDVVTGAALENPRRNWSEAVCWVWQGGAGVCVKDPNPETSNPSEGPPFEPWLRFKAIDAAKMSVSEDSVCILHEQGNVTCLGKLASPAADLRFRQIGLGRNFGCGIGLTLNQLECWGEVPFSPFDQNVDQIAVLENSICVKPFGLNEIRCRGDGWKRTMSQIPAPILRLDRQSRELVSLILENGQAMIGTATQMYDPFLPFWRFKN